MTKRPLIRTAPVSEFGEFDAEAGAGMGNDLALDNTYVPGWSDLKHQRDLALADLAEGRIRPEEVPALPVNVRLVRRQTAGGTFDGKKLMGAANAGYLPLTKDELGEKWFTAMPPGAKELEDGSIVNAAGDLQYMYCPQQAAARNLHRKTQRMLDHAKLAGEVVRGGVVEAGGTWEREALP